jgi:ribose 5-phosphate isomerase B
MKKFDIITEADARVLDRGTTVELARGGHITPLAHDTLRERRIVVTEEGRTASNHAGLAPVADVRSLAIGSDPAGSALRRPLVAFLRARGLAVDDQGLDQETAGSDAAEYPAIAARVARAVSSHEADAGIVIDAGGIGPAIAANKIQGIRAAMAASETMARYAREHHGANVLTLGAAFLTLEEATAIVVAWLTTSMRDPKAIARLAQIVDLEKR